MATLADELLNDFEDSGSEGDGRGAIDDLAENGDATTPPHIEPATGMELDGDEEEVEDADEESEAGKSKPEAGIANAADENDTKARVEKMQLGGVSDVRSVASLMKPLQPVLEKIAQFQSLPSNQRVIGNIEDNPEYKLLTQSNSLSTSIDGEIILVHKFIRDHYSARFAELENLVTNPLDYAKTVAIIKNGPLGDIKSIASSANNMVGQPLNQILDGPTLMVVTVEATSTRGRTMSESELQTVLRACEMALSLDRAKKILTDYVQSRMNIFAPNLTALIGSLTAAQLINYAGGITGLAKTPACNIAPLGSKKQSGTGFATNVGVRQRGFLFQSPVIQAVPNEYKKQAMRIVSAKLVLAARVDRVHESPDGSQGEILKSQCEDRLEKLQEAPKNQGARALPAPDDKPARKRGGRRARKAKEAVAMTDMQKQRNRMAFGKEEKEVGYGTGEGTKGLGMLGQENDGRIRSGQIDQRTKARLSKKNPGWGGTATSINSGTASSLRGFGSGVGGNATTLRAQGLRTSGIGSGAGTASSIAFTPVQGLELVDPKVQAELSKKRKLEEDRWFKGGTFTQIGGQSNGGTTSNGGFKVPQLPQKKVDTGAAKMGPPPPPKVSGL